MKTSLKFADMSQPIEKLQPTIVEEAVSRAEIAIIDDDPGFSFMLKDYLTSANYNSEIFTNGGDFLKSYKSGDTRMLILDYEFDKGPNGLAVLKEIKKINPLAQVIVVSAQDDLEKAVETLRKGATDYFLKTNKTVFANILCSLNKLREMEKNRWN
jgi:DNA-binding NtrC family response regulator